MLDNDHKTPIPKVMDVAVFHQKSGADGHSLKRFAAKTIEKGSKLRTDGWGA